MTRRLALPATVEACLFDLDGVLTKTATLHASAWKRAFDDFLAERARAGGERPAPFDADADYRTYVDGRPRTDGVRSFLASRGIALPEGSADDPSSTHSVAGVARRKNDLVQELMAERGVAAYKGSVRFLAAVEDAGLRRAVVTSSENAAGVLRAAGLDEMFEVRVDGAAARKLGLRGKPAPDVFIEAADRLDVAPERAAVFEDAIAGVQAGRAGGFGFVVGVARAGDAQALRDAGADIVVGDLADLLGAP